MDLKCCKIINLIHDDFEDLELWYPTLRLREEGIAVHLVGESKGVTYKGKYGVPAVADFGFKEVNPASYDGLLVPGGWAPDKLRRFPEALMRAVRQAGKPIGQICHAGWLLISAGIKGRRVTSVGAIRDDMVNAGAQWVDKAVVVDGNLVSSRRPPVAAHGELLTAEVKTGLDWNGSESVAIEAIARHPLGYANEIHDRGSSPDPEHIACGEMRPSEEGRTDGADRVTARRKQGDRLLIRRSWVEPWR
jgi:protease I